MAPLYARTLEVVSGCGFLGPAAEIVSKERVIFKADNWKNAVGGGIWNIWRTSESKYISNTMLP